LAQPLSRRFHVGTSPSGSLKMPDIRLQVFPQARYIDQGLAVGGESIYDLLGRAFMIGL
jgi:hypothetical protein